MDPVSNPYAPGAGTRPPELAGRDEVIAMADIALRRVVTGKPERSLILVGLRGVGKTVLLNEIKQISDDLGFLSALLEAHEGRNLAELISPFLRTALYRLSSVEAAKEISRRGLRVLKSFLKSVKIRFNEIEVGLSVDAEVGTADSGSLENDLPELFVVLGKAAAAAGRPIVILIDELQYLSSEEFSALIMAIHQINQNNLPILIVGAGLPQKLGLAGNSKSYAERLFRFPEIGALAEPDAISAVVTPAKDEGASFSDRAVALILKETQMYPYFIQQWSYEAWNHSAGPVISCQDVVEATPKAIDELDKSFFKVRFDRCTPSEKKYMRALAEFGDGDHRSGAIAEKLGVKSQSAAPTRNSLIKKGMIYSPSHGDTAFTVPLFHEYMSRAMPN